MKMRNLGKNTEIWQNMTNFGAPCLTMKHDARMGKIFFRPTQIKTIKYKLAALVSFI